jgi:hypothetical protein
METEMLLGLLEEYLAKQWILDIYDGFIHRDVSHPCVVVITRTLDFDDEKKVVFETAMRRIVGTKPICYGDPWLEHSDLYDNNDDDDVDFNDLADVWSKAQPRCMEWLSIHDVTGVSAGTRDGACVIVVYVKSTLYGCAPMPTEVDGVGVVLRPSIFRQCSRHLSSARIGNPLCIEDQWCSLGGMFRVGSDQWFAMSTGHVVPNPCGEQKESWRVKKLEHVTGVAHTITASDKTPDADWEDVFPSGSDEKFSFHSHDFGHVVWALRGNISHLDPYDLVTADQSITRVDMVSGIDASLIQLYKPWKLYYQNNKMPLLPVEFFVDDFNKWGSDGSCTASTLYHLKGKMFPIHSAFDVKEPVGWTVRRWVKRVSSMHVELPPSNPKRWLLNQIALDLTYGIKLSAYERTVHDGCSGSWLTFDANKKRYVLGCFQSGNDKDICIFSRMKPTLLRMCKDMNWEHLSVVIPGLV